MTNLGKNNQYISVFWELLIRGKEIGSGVFPTISRINHSCRPNCVLSYNISSGECEVGFVYLPNLEIGFRYSQDFGRSWVLMKDHLQFLKAHCNKIPDRILLLVKQITNWSGTIDRLYSMKILLHHLLIFPYFFISLFISMYIFYSSVLFSA